MTKNEQRQAIEKEIATQIVTSALAAGYEIGVDNGGDEEEYRGKNKEEILKNMFATDSEYLYMYRASHHTSASGYVLLVYGNDGWDVMSDWTTSLDPVLAEAQELSDKYSN